MNARAAEYSRGCMRSTQRLAINAWNNIMIDDPEHSNGWAMGIYALQFSQSLSMLVTRSKRCLPPMPCPSVCVCVRSLRALPHYLSASACIESSPTLAAPFKYFIVLDSRKMRRKRKKLIFNWNIAQERHHPRHAAAPAGNTKYQIYISSIMIEAKRCAPHTSAATHCIYIG